MLVNENQSCPAPKNDKMFHMSCAVLQVLSDDSFQISHIQNYLKFLP